MKAIRTASAMALAIVASAAAAPPGAGGAHGGAEDGSPRRHRMRPFISPMGEPFRDGPDPAGAWFAGVDANHDGKLTRAEFRADAMRFFATLDLNHDHEIGPDEIDHYEQVIAPETGSGGFGGGMSAKPDRRSGGGRHGGRGPGGGMRGGGGGGGGRDGGGGEPGDNPPSQGGGPSGSGTMPQGAARYGYLALPEPVVAADADLNRGISEAEFAQAAERRFTLLDTNGDGTITPDDLPKLAGGGDRRARASGARDRRPGDE